MIRTTHQACSRPDGVPIRPRAAVRGLRRLVGLLCLLPLIAVVMAGPAARPAAAQVYSATYPTGVGMLFSAGDVGLELDPNNGYGDDGQSLNASGVVAFGGVANNTLWYDRGLRWDGQTVVDQGWNVLGLIGEGGAFGINGTGIVAGYKVGNGGSHALLWDGTTTYDLSPALGYQAGVARSINDSGEVAGITKLPGTPARYRAFTYDGTTVHTLSPLTGDTDSMAYGINAAGQVVGGSCTYPTGFNPLDNAKACGHAVLWDSAGSQDLGTLPGNDQSLAYGINASGQVVGWSWSSTAGGSKRAFMSDTGGMHDLGTLGGAISQARAINSAGQIVGGSQLATGEYHACLWANGARVDLNDMLLNGALGGGYVLVVANGINDRGQIVCETDSHRPVLLTPLSVPIARLSPASLVFGAQPLGTSSSVQSVTLTNTGQAPLHVANIAITGTNPPEFVIVSDTGESTLATGATRTLTVRFSPIAAGSRGATLSVTSDTTPVQGLAQIGLLGVGTAPMVDLSPASLSFGSQRVGTTSADQTLVLHNFGEAPLDIHSVTLAGAGAGEFAAANLAGTTLAPNDTRTITVHFTPVARGLQSATLVIDSNDPGGPTQVPLTGTGLAPVLRVSPLALDFGNEPVGLSGSLGVLLQNTGDAPLLVRGISFTGPNAAEFSLASSLGTGETLQPGDLTLLNVRFSPAVTGSRAASMVVDSDSSTPVSAVSLAGTGTEPLLRLSDLALLFGIQPGGTAATQTLLLTNNGDTPLTIDGLILSGADAASFRIVGDTGEKSLNPDASRTVTISFSPATVGSARRAARTAAAHIASATYSAVLQFGHNDPHPGSPHQVSLTAAAVPGAPTGLTASAAGNKINLTWTDNSSSETAMELFRKVGAGSFTRIAVLAPNSTAFLDTGVAGSTSYTYEVRTANNFWASAFSNPASVTTSFPPAAPSGLTANAAGNKINLAWAVNSSNETAIELYRKVGAGGFVLLTVLPPKTSHFTDPSPAGSTTYTYQVRAANDFWASASSNVASVTTQFPPAAPTGLKVIGISYNKVTLAWTDNSANETAFEIYRKSGSGPSTLVGVVAPNSSFFQDTTVSPATGYTYQVRAANDFWASAYTNPVNATTIPAPPAAPTVLTATAVSSTQINLAWTDNSSNETAFEVYRAVGADSYVLVAVLAPNTTAYADKSVVAGTSYSYRVRAANDYWASAYTNMAGASTP